MALKVDVYPVRKRLPSGYSTEIGRIIVRWALVEWHLKRLSYDILKISPKAGRVAVQDPSADRYITMIEDLLSIRSIKTDIDWRLIRDELHDIETFRNKISHGIWVHFPNETTPILQDTRGKHPNMQDPHRRKGRINPKALRITLEALKSYRQRIDAAVATLDSIRRSLHPVLWSEQTGSP